jgi:hypothetical protein
MTQSGIEPVTFRLEVQARTSVHESLLYLQCCQLIEISVFETYRHIDVVTTGLGLKFWRPLQLTAELHTSVYQLQISGLNRINIASTYPNCTMPRVNYN